MDYESTMANQNGGHIEWEEAEILGEIEEDDKEWWGVIEGDLFAQQFIGIHFSKLIKK